MTVGVHRKQFVTVELIGIVVRIGIGQMFEIVALIDIEHLHRQLQPNLVHGYIVMVRTNIHRLD